MSATRPPSILRLRDLQHRVNLSRSMIYARIAAGDFPPPIALGPRAVGWLAADVQKWIRSRVKKTVRP
jgi:prophage regulatory protein